MNYIPRLTAMYYWIRKINKLILFLLLVKVLIKGKQETRPERLYICKINMVATLESTGEEVEHYDDFIFQLSDQEIVQGNKLMQLIY